MSKLVEPCLVRQRVQRIDSDAALACIAHGVAIGGLEGHFVHTECAEGLVGIPCRDTRLRQLRSFGLAQDEPARAIDEPSEGGCATVCTVSVSTGFLLALERQRHAQRQRLLALADVPAEFFPPWIGGHRAEREAALVASLQSY